MLSLFYPTTISQNSKRRNDRQFFDPFQEIFNDFDTRMSKLESNSDVKVSGLEPFGRGSTFYPPVDVYETEKEFVITSSVPGVAPSDINIDYDSTTRQLSILGEVKDEHTDEFKDKHQKVYERSYGQFERTITLPESSTVDDDNIQAEISNGVLKLIVPKMEVKTKSKRSIPITARNSIEQPKVKDKKN